MMTERITEIDVDSDGIWPIEEESEKDFWDEVRDCCGGRNYWCGPHWRRYPPERERSEP